MRFSSELLSLALEENRLALQVLDDFKARAVGVLANLLIGGYRRGIPDSVSALSNLQMSSGVCQISRTYLPGEMNAFDPGPIAITMSRKQN